MIRVLLADDHPVFREGARAVLERNELIRVVGEASTCAEAERLAVELDVDVVVLDLAMPRRGGLETLKAIRRRAPDVGLIVVSMYREELYAVRAIRAGALAYIEKSRAGEHLLKAVERAARGERYLTDSVSDRLADFVSRTGPGKAYDKLTDREIQVLRLLAAGERVTDIADELALSAKTVSTYRARILEKLGLETTADLIRFAVDAQLAE